MAGDTAGNIVNAAAVQLRLLPFSGKLADPFASTDANIGMLCQLFTSLGRDVRRRRQWNLLRHTYVFQTAANQGLYALPVDFGQKLDNADYNRSNRLPLLGPLTGQQRERLKSLLTGVTFNLMYEVLQGQFRAFPDNTTPGGYVLAYEYISAFWAQAAGTHAVSGEWTNGAVYGTNAYVQHGGRIYKTTAGGTSGTYGPLGTSTASDGSIADWAYQSDFGKDNVSASSDVCLFDAEVMIRGLKYLYKRENGFESSMAEEDFLATLASAVDDDAVGAKLNLSASVQGDDLIGEQSIPWTGFALPGG